MRMIAALGVLLMLGTQASSADEVETARREILERLDRIRNNPDRLSESDRLAAFIDAYFDYTLLEFPEFATYIGHPEGNDRWTDGSLEAVGRRDRDALRALEVIRSIERSRLEGADRLNYDLLAERLGEEVEGQRFGSEYLAITQLGGVQQDVARLLTMMPARHLSDYENILARLNGVPALVDQTIERLRQGLEEGITPPRITLRDVPQQVLNLLVDDPLESPMLKAFREFPQSIPEKDRELLRETAIRSFTDRVSPAYRRLHSFLIETYLPAARRSIAMKDLPDGADWYAHRVRRMTTTDLTPEEIHRIGLSEVKRIREEMDQVIRESGFEGSFEEFTRFLRTDPRFFFDEPEALLRAYRDISKRADAGLVRLFGRLPRLPYGVIPVPPYAEKSQTTAYYEPGSLEAGRPGFFFANTYALDSRPSWEMEALTLHEAVPGHHLQISIAQEMKDLPWFRRFGTYTAFVEGWGLYAEGLGGEMGFYTDPYSKFGQLTYEMWRAIRLVVDTGMHALGWSRQQAIDYFRANTGKAEHDIVVEVDRYIVMPAQALAYKIGELKLRELRAYARRQLGEDFDIRAFHDRVLGNGALPLSVLERHVREWVASRQALSRASPGE
ncbi:MAG: DUF885 family protein [Acidobacteriota bacterium]